MKTFLFLSSLLFVSFIPSFSDAASFERVCREATSGDDYKFCISALEGIPTKETTNIRELAITAIGHLMANHTINGGTPNFDFGSIFECIAGVVKIVGNLQAAIAKVQVGDLPGAIEDIINSVNAIQGCIGENSIGTNKVSPEVIVTRMKTVDVVGKIINWLVKVD